MLNKAKTNHIFKIRLAGAKFFFFFSRVLSAGYKQILVFTGSRGLLIAVTLRVIECLSNNPGNSTALQTKVYSYLNTKKFSLKLMVNQEEITTKSTVTIVQVLLGSTMGLLLERSRK